MNQIETYDLPEDVVGHIDQMASNLGISSDDVIVRLVMSEVTGERWEPAKPVKAEMDIDN